MPLNLPNYLTSYEGPRGHSSSSYGAAYDYAGLDQQLKDERELGTLRDAKFNAIYSGDVPSSVTLGNRVRDLLKAVRAHAQTAGERNPINTINPLVRVAREDRSDSNSFGGASWRGDNGAPSRTSP